jgi:UDP-2,3-diacylglucosamine pyrophosphatase LpxH
MKLINIEKRSDLSYYISLDRYKDANQRFLLLSDLHIDNPKCDRKLLLKVLNQAKEQNAIILIFGDLFCLMQGKGDPRRSKADIRPEHNKPNYIDTVVKDTASILKPFANNIALIADGNHETSIIKHIEVDPIDYLLNYMHKYNPQIQHAGYQGFVRLNTYVKATNSNSKNIDIFFHHGAWGGAVTKGVMSVNRYASIVKSDVVVSGHTHDTWYVEHPFYEMKKNGEVVQKTQYHIKTGTFKQEYLVPNGFQIEKQVMPKPLGGWWMDFIVGKTNFPERLQFQKAD